MAVQYAGEVFPHDNVASRYTLLIGAGDIKDDVARASQTALMAAVKKANNPDMHKRKKEAPTGPILPDFMEMLAMILDKSAIRAKSSFKVVIGDTVLPFSVAVGAQVCDYIRLCLWNSAGVLPSKEMLEDPMSEAPKVAKFLNKVIADGGSKKRELIVKFIDLVERLLKASAGMSQALALLHFIGAGPADIGKKFAKKMDWFKYLLDNTREEFRETIAAVYGLVSAALSEQEFDKAVTDLTRSLKEKQLEFQHGSILALGHSFGRRLLLSKEDKMASADIYVKITKMMVGSLDNSHNMIISAACLALAELGRYNKTGFVYSTQVCTLSRSGPLPLEAGEVKDKPEADTKLALVTRLLALVKSGKVYFFCK